MYINPWFLAAPAFGFLLVGIWFGDRSNNGRTKLPVHRAKFYSSLFAALGFVFFILWRFDVAHSPSEIQKRLNRQNAETLKSLNR